MNRNNIDSLYTLIKEQKDKKGRPLKIVCDWDECLFSFRATAIYGFTNGKSPFKEIFEEFWEKAVDEINDHECPNNPSASRKFIYVGTGELRTAYEKFEKLYKERNKDSNKSADKYKKIKRGW